MTITADFSGGEKTATTEPLYQWDTGQKLALSGLPATSTDIQVHFANAAMAQAIVKATELVDSLPTCDIPNEFLQFGSAAKARAWVYYKEGSSKGYTIKTVLIPITPRKRPNDYVSPTDPDSKGIVEQAIELLESYETDITGKEDVSNKKTTLTGNESSNDFYPTTKAVADAIENLGAIPYSVKLAMDTLFSKAAYAGDDAASSYATFHAWAMGTLTLFDWDYTEGMNGTIKSVTSVEPTMAADGLLLQGGENLYSICAIAPNIATLTEPYKTTITYSDLSADADNGEVAFCHYHATEGRVSIHRQRRGASISDALKTFVTDGSNQQTVLSWNLTDSGTIEIEYDNVAGTVKFTQGANSYTVTVGTVSEGVVHPKIAFASKGRRNTSVKIQHIRIERTVQA